MKKLVFLFALFILLKPALPVVDYFANYGYIVAELCLNRDKPELECNGKCYLKDQLAKSSETETPFSQNQKQASQGFDLLFFQEFEEQEFIGFFDFKNPIFPQTCNLNLTEPNFSIFHPPILS